MFENIIVLFAVVFAVIMPYAILVSLMEWMDKNNRTFFFVKMYRKWCIKKGKRVVANAKKAY